MRVWDVKGRMEPVRHSGLHHAAVCTRDWATTMRFWVDGLGLQLQYEQTVEGDWAELFAASGNVLRSAFLCDPSVEQTGIVEIVEFPSGVVDGAPSTTPAEGFFLLSFYVDVEATLTRLAALGLGGPPRRIAMDAPFGRVPMAVVRDPNGVLVELIGRPERR